MPTDDQKATSSLARSIALRAMDYLSDKPPTAMNGNEIINTLYELAEVVDEELNNAKTND